MKIYFDNFFYDGFQQCSNLEQDTNLIADFANETRFYLSDVELVKGKIKFTLETELQYSSQFSLEIDPMPEAKAVQSINDTIYTQDYDEIIMDILIKSIKNRLLLNDVHQDNLTEITTTSNPDISNDFSAIDSSSSVSNALLIMITKTKRNLFLIEIF